MNNREPSPLSPPSPQNLQKFHAQAEVLSAELLARYETAALKTAVAESCTGGLLAQIITATPNSSAIFCGGIVSYSNAAKMRLLGVSESLLAQHGAVSEQVAIAMVQGTLQAFPEAHTAAAITGVAGPGASEKKPAGLVYIAYGKRLQKGQSVSCEACHFQGDREQVRQQSALQALQALIDLS